MAEFDEVRLELGFDYSATGGPTIKTEVVTMDSGREQVNTPWLNMLGEWNIGTRNMLGSEKDYLLAFFRARQGPVRGFRFKDWVDFSAKNQTIGTGDGSKTAFQLVKHYESGGISIRRDIKKPVAGTSTVYVNGSAVSHALDTTTGIVSLTSAPAVNDVITADFEFDVPVRFASNAFKVAFKAFDPDTGEGVFYLGGLSVKEILL